MTFTFHHSLASRAAVSVVVSLWYHEDIDSLKRIGGYREGDAHSSSSSATTGIYFLPWRMKDSAKSSHRLALHSRVKTSVLELFLPESAKRYLLEFVQVVGENLQDWITDHFYAPKSSVLSFWRERFVRTSSVGTIGRKPGKSEADAEIDVDLRKVLRWNADGEIDLEQTGDALVRNQSDSIKRFRLAYDYCREDEMMRLWPSVKGYFSEPGAWVSNLAYDTCALFWWRYFRHVWPESILTYLFDYGKRRPFEKTGLFEDELLWSCFSDSVYYYSPLAVYLSNKIRAVNSDQLREARATGYIGQKSFRVIFFRMQESCHVQLLRDSPKGYLEQLLLWRHQSFFIDTVERNWDIFDEDLFDSFLLMIARTIQWYDESDIYKQLFLWYWTASPSHLRDVERIFYDRELQERCRTTLRHFVGIHFCRSKEAEATMKRLLFAGEHVFDLLMRLHVRDVLSDLVRSCLPAEEWDEKQEMLKTFFDMSPLY